MESKKTLSVPLWAHTRNALCDCIRYELYKLVLLYMSLKKEKTTFYLRQTFNQTIQRGNTEKKKMESKLTEKEVKAKVGKKNGRKIGT